MENSLLIIVYSIGGQKYNLFLQIATFLRLIEQFNRLEKIQYYSKILAIPAW